MQTNAPAPQKLDNLFGVCHALGGAFGFNPLYLRIAIVFGILINFEVTAILYAAAGVAVLSAHLLSKVTARRDARREA
ncbi:PspC domain-containing protein [Sphingomonas sp. MMS24-J13]|uniref:PspC domain-containing protein n=1 Tax=Sphingomonas sp. MMS24-J13 TaxID=3238686 RepID=UPI003850C7BF